MLVTTYSESEFIDLVNNAAKEIEASLMPIEALKAIYSELNSKDVGIIEFEPQRIQYHFTWYESLKDFNQEQETNFDSMDDLVNNYPLVIPYGEDGHFAIQMP